MFKPGLKRAHEVCHTETGISFQPASEDFLHQTIWLVVRHDDERPIQNKTPLNKITAEKEWNIKNE